MKRWLLCCLVATFPCISEAVEPHLTKHRVAYLADVAAKHTGYDLNRFRRLKPHYIPEGHYWIVFYDGKPDRNGMNTVGNNFSVDVDDRNGHASTTPGK